MFRYDVVNAVAERIGARRYLEIGVQRGEAFRQIRVTEKVGVDPDPGAPATVTLTSDRYFASIPPSDQFDLVFVDGLHHADQVLVDIGNALRHLSPGGAIVVHDCDPPNEMAGRREMCRGCWCGDVWRGWLRARLLYPELYCAVVDTDLGCGVMLPRSFADPVPAPYDVDTPDSIDWTEYRSRRAEYLNLITVDQFRSLVRG